MNNSISKLRWFVGVVVLGAILVFGFYGVVRTAMNQLNLETDSNGLAMSFPEDAMYTEECGACHLPYPPGLLPIESWTEIIAGLDDHFGDNAEIEKPIADGIVDYLDRYALRPGEPSTMSRMLREFPKGFPLRISELPSFIHDHLEISARIEGSNFVNTAMSQCDSCHLGSVRGIFTKVKIPLDFLAGTEK